MSTGSQRSYGPLWARWIPARARDAYFQARAQRIEAEHLQELASFYAALPDKKDIFYMFFTSGLLQWAARAISFVPADVQLVLLGSDLQEDEIVWIRENVRRPFHHIRLHVDDRAVWELLFAINQQNFGWIDVDCFVLHPELLREMTQLGPRTVASTVWSFAAPGGIDMLSTFCVFLNVDAIRAVTAAVAVSPDVYSHKLIRRPGSSYAYTKLLTPTHVRWLRRVLPAGRRGRPVYLNGDEYFDTLHVYQLIANALGYRVERARPLTLKEQLSSDEAVHIGKVSYYRRYKNRSDARLRNLHDLLLQADFVLLSDMEGGLPLRYRRLRESLAPEIEELGLTADVGRLQENVCQEMVRRGASASSIRRILAGAN